MKKYKYPEPNSKRVFILSNFDNNNNAVFKCGHKVSQSVFVDLIDLKTGIAEWEKMQTKLKL